MYCFLYAILNIPRSLWTQRIVGILAHWGSIDASLKISEFSKIKDAKRAHIDECSQLWNSACRHSRSILKRAAIEHASFTLGNSQSSEESKVSGVQGHLVDRWRTETKQIQNITIMTPCYLQYAITADCNIGEHNEIIKSTSLILDNLHVFTWLSFLKCFIFQMNRGKIIDSLTTISSSLVFLSQMLFDIVLVCAFVLRHWLNVLSTVHTHTHTHYHNHQCFHNQPLSLHT